VELTSKYVVLPGFGFGRLIFQIILSRWQMFPAKSAVDTAFKMEFFVTFSHDRDADPVCLLVHFCHSMRIFRSKADLGQIGLELPG
jgi:hypothetical protein